MKLYYYDHCPYCVKARMIFGLKQLPITLVILRNDDEATPIGMIGVKMVPILEKAAGDYMPESMDIVRYVDALNDTPLLTRGSNADVTAWLAQSSSYLYKLAMPRWVRTPLEEFATENARTYFIRKKEAMIGAFADVMEHSADYIAQANQHLLELEAMIPQDDALYGEEDIHLFATLRSLSIVKGINYPANVRNYRERLSHASNVPLHDDIAL